LRGHSIYSGKNFIAGLFDQALCKSTILTSAIKSGQSLGDRGQMALVSTYLLSLWCLQGIKSGNGFGFPFDRPLQEFACRLLTLNDCLSALQLPEKDRISKRLFSKLLRLIRDVVANPAFNQAVEELKWRILIFDDLREKMRIAKPASCNGLNDDGTDNAMKSIRKGVQKFRSGLIQHLIKLWFASLTQSILVR
jgi:hypothetical protein